jgi:hypothetical protein
MNNINYIYHHCSSQDFKNEVSFSEEIFSKKLNEAFELDINIERIDVIFTINKSQETEKFEVSIKVISPELKHFDIIEKGNDEAGTTRAAIDKTILQLRNHKSKTHHH